MGDKVLLCSEWSYDEWSKSLELSLMIHESAGVYNQREILLNFFMLRIMASIIFLCSKAFTAFSFNIADQGSETPFVQHVNRLIQFTFHAVCDCALWLEN
jgi:hypothetical protein